MIKMKYVSVADIASKWGVTKKRVQTLCSDGRIDGCQKVGNSWIIPENAIKPTDKRIKSGKYVKKENPTADSKVKIFSFFSGCGILDLGFENSGYEIDFVNEISDPFLKAYIHSRKVMNIPEPLYGYQNTDINRYLTDLKPDLKEMVKKSHQESSLIGFIGGPPCPDFSIAGKQKGKDGENGKLSQSYVDLICSIKPDFFLFENVKGLWRTARHRSFYEGLKIELKKHGYFLTERLTNALEFGVPQDRDRIILIGIRGNLIKPEYKGENNELLNFPWLENVRYDLDRLKGLDWPSTTPFLEGSSIDCPEGLIREVTPEYWFERNDVLHHPNVNRFFTPKAGLKKMKEIPEGDTNKKSYKRIHRWRYSPTVAYGNNEVHLHPYFPRRLSVAEAMSLQSLPAEFELPNDMTLTDSFKTIGNGVPYLMALGIAGALRNFLRYSLK